MFLRYLSSLLSRYFKLRSDFLFVYSTLWLINEIFKREMPLRPLVDFFVSRQVFVINRKNVFEVSRVQFLVLVFAGKKS